MTLLHKWTHKQYIQVDTIFNYMFHFGPPGTYIYVPKEHPSGAGQAGARKAWFPDLSKDMLLEIQNEQLQTCG